MSKIRFGRIMSLLSSPQSSSLSEATFISDVTSLFFSFVIFFIPSHVSILPRPPTQILFLHHRLGILCMTTKIFIADAQYYLSHGTYSFLFAHLLRQAMSRNIQCDATPRGDDHQAPAQTSLHLTNKSFSHALLRFV